MCAERGVRSDAADPAAVSAEDAIANRAGMPVGL
jgi:hypothetical protein